MANLQNRSEIINIFRLKKLIFVDNLYKMQFRIQSFPPIISKKSKILILGSIPGTKSLEKQEYYAHPQNHFWKILFCMFGEEVFC